MSYRLGNGDGYLKYLGVMYGDLSDSRTGSIFDVVCRIGYLPKDLSALTLGGLKALV